MKRVILTAIAIVFLFASPLLWASGNSMDAGDTTDLQAPIPVDPNATIGEFENGVRYYVIQNKEPENRGQQTYFKTT